MKRSINQFQCRWHGLFSSEGVVANKTNRAYDVDVSNSLQNTQSSALKAHRALSVPSIQTQLGESRLKLNPEFPLNVRLDGWRDDKPITLMHVHNALELGFCISGSGTFYVGSKILRFKAGDMTVITPHEYHRCNSTRGASSRWVWFFLDPIRLLVRNSVSKIVWEPERFSGDQFSNVIHDQSQPTLHRLMNLLVSEARHQDDFRKSNLCSLLHLLINELHRCFPRRNNSQESSVEAASLSRIVPALNLVARKYDRSIKITQLAESCDLSVRSLQMHFKDQMDMTPQAYLMKVRVQAAATMLGDSNKSITEVALNCGFNSLSTFNRAFSKVHSMSPRAYRKRLGKT